jgi:hypothetical protein
MKNTITDFFNVKRKTEKFNVAEIKLAPFLNLEILSTLN